MRVNKYLSMTIDQITQCCAVWQMRLRLADWKIRIEFAKGKDLPPGSAGMCSPLLQNKTAAIYILAPDDLSDVNDDVAFPMSVERILVHELLHLHFYPLTQQRQQDVVIEEEQAIECITDSLMNAYGPMKFDDSPKEAKVSRKAKK